MMENPAVAQVFDGIGAVVDGGRAIANMATNTFDILSNIGNPQGGGGLFSRRDYNYQAPQQQAQYQPSTYPWATSPNVYGGYQMQPQGIVGYPGITNPNYGHPGFYTGAFNQNNSGLWSYNNQNANSSMPTWVNQIWR